MPAVREKVAKKTSDAADAPRPSGQATVKLSQDLHRRARTVASYRGLDLGDYIDQLLRHQVDADYAKMADEIRREDK